MTPAGPPRAGSAAPRAATGLVLACLMAAVVTVGVVGAGVSVRAADVGAAAVDEPQYLLTALSLAEDGDLDISDERAQARYTAFHDVPPPIQTAEQADGRRVSPHDPLLPLLLAPAMGQGGYLAAKWVLVLIAGLLAAATTYLAATRYAVPVVLAAVVSTLAGTVTPLAVYGHQVYPELPAALAVVATVLLVVPPAGRSADAWWSPLRVLAVVVSVSALPWLAVKYAPVAAALAVVALCSLRRASLRLTAVAVVALAASGAVWLGAHQLLYGGWTAYASGDHFQAKGEFSAVGFEPNYLGRSTRLIGLITDRDYGLAAWAPVWLLGLAAIPFAARARQWALVLPVAAGWLTATFVALTMQGYWWPGRQVVVVLPLVAVAVAVLLHRSHGPIASWVRGGAVLAAAVSLGVQAWVTLAGRTGTLTWVGAPDRPAAGWIDLARTALPDYRRGEPVDWALHAAWIVAALLLAAFGLTAAPRGTSDERSGRHSPPSQIPGEPQTNGHPHPLRRSPGNLRRTVIPGPHSRRRTRRNPA